jgi:atypical dual specificity phosphatase
MAEWQIQPSQARKERQAQKLPAWRVAADQAWERSGARFMMQEAGERADPPPTLLLVVLTGLPGSGKSFLAAQLKARGFALVCQDQLGSRQACEEAVTDLMKRGRRCVVDRCNHTNQQRDLWTALMATHAPKVKNACALVLHLDGDVAECKRRVLSRMNHKTLPPVAASAAVVDDFARKFEDPSQARVWTVEGAWDGRQLALAVDASGTLDEVPPEALAPPPPPPVEGGAVARLVAMGWAAAVCEAALQVSNADEAAAVDLLLGHSAAEVLALAAS